MDLPLVLELLATLSEAGLGFDSARWRILESGLADRVLGENCDPFKQTLLPAEAESMPCGDWPVALRSAPCPSSSRELVQAEQLGTGIAMVFAPASR